MVDVQKKKNDGSIAWLAGLFLFLVAIFFFNTLYVLYWEEDPVQVVYESSETNNIVNPSLWTNQSGTATYEGNVNVSGDFFISNDTYGVARHYWNSQGQYVIEIS